MERLTQYDHLATSDLRDLSAAFARLAEQIIPTLPDHPDTAEFLRKLWEAKNCAVYVAARIGFVPAPPEY